MAGIELYFDDLDSASEFYSRSLGLRLQNKKLGHHAQFDGGGSFICLERKGVENYPSLDKGVLFLEVRDFDAAVARIGRGRMVGGTLEKRNLTQRWAVFHDPEGHNIVLLEKRAWTGHP